MRAYHAFLSIFAEILPKLKGRVKLSGTGNPSPTIYREFNEDCRGGFHIHPQFRANLMCGTFVKVDAHIDPQPRQCADLADERSSPLQRLLFHHKNRVMADTLPSARAGRRGRRPLYNACCKIA